MENVKASLVYDGQGDPLLPLEMGSPREDQLLGTPAEKLSEICGRICYDSCGSGRSSKDFHKHILDVGHFSVHEHFNYTVLIESDSFSPTGICALYGAAINRPGVLITTESVNRIRMTLNIRSVLEWDNWSKEFILSDSLFVNMAKSLGEGLKEIAFGLTPQVINTSRLTSTSFIDLGYGLKLYKKVVEPKNLHEKWVSMFLSSSRGVSHEQVRHGNYSAISQRSTRFVDESSSPLVMHPLLGLYLQETNDVKISSAWEQSVNHSKNAYSEIVSSLQEWISSRGVDKLTSRKQARGAARGILGNALMTEMIFSASIYQWRHMLKLRCSQAADAEIRLMYENVLRELKSSRYKDCFIDLSLTESPDGIGKVIKTD